MKRRAALGALLALPTYRLGPPLTDDVPAPLEVPVRYLGYHGMIEHFGEVQFVRNCQLMETENA